MDDLTLEHLQSELEAVAPTQEIIAMADWIKRMTPAQVEELVMMYSGRSDDRRRIRAMVANIRRHDDLLAENMADLHSHLRSLEARAQEIDDLKAAYCAFEEQAERELGAMHRRQTTELAYTLIAGCICIFLVVPWWFGSLGRLQLAGFACASLAVLLWWAQTSWRERWTAWTTTISWMTWFGTTTACLVVLR